MSGDFKKMLSVGNLVRSHVNCFLPYRFESAILESP
jgi:hypothetical protein